MEESLRFILCIGKIALYGLIWATLFTFYSRSGDFNFTGDNDFFSDLYGNRCFSDTPRKYVAKLADLFYWNVFLSFVFSFLTLW